MLSGLKAIVTGASRGIGAATATKLCELGAQVAIIYNGSEDKAKAVAQNINAKIYKCNVADFDECKQTVDQIISDFGGVDILVNNAGITKDNLVMTMEVSDFDDVINTNLKGAFNMIKACSRNFIKRKHGKIINISSVSGLSGLPGQANYSASKAGIIGLTKSVAKEFGGKNICCNAVAPGFIATDMTKDLTADEFLKTIPLKRIGNPEDIANVVAFLSSGMSDYITGEVIRVDGGLAM